MADTLAVTTGLRKNELASLTAGQLDLDGDFPCVRLNVAGNPNRDDRGRVLDVHALRHTFGTMLSVAGVSPRVAHSAMRIRAST